MATKDSFLSSKTTFDISNSSKSDSQYSNLNLNQNNLCSKIVPIHSKTNDSINSKKETASNKVTDNFNQKESQICFTNESENGSNRLNGILSNLYNPKVKNSKSIQNYSTTTKSSSSNNSTLSLHIAAYENANSAASNFNENNDSKESKKKSWKNIKQTFVDSKTTAKDSFEIPRQQSNGTSKPEIMQFKASQILLNSNKTNQISEKILADFKKLCRTGDQKDENYARLKREFDEQKESIEKLKIELEQANVQIAEYAADIQSRTLHSFQMHESHANLQVKFEQANESRQKFEDEIKRLKECNDKLRANVAEKDQMIEDLSTKIEQSPDLIAKLEDEIKDTKDIIAKLNSMANENKQKYEAEFIRLKKDNDGLKTKISENDQKNENFEKQQQEFRLQIEKLEAEIKSKTDEINQMKGILLNKDEMIKNLQDDDRNLRDRIDELEVQIDALNNGVAGFSTSVINVTFPDLSISYGDDADDDEHAGAGEDVSSIDQMFEGIIQAKDVKPQPIIVDESDEYVETESGENNSEDRDDVTITGSEEDGDSSSDNNDSEEEEPLNKDDENSAEESGTINLKTKDGHPCEILSIDKIEQKMLFIFDSNERNKYYAYESSKAEEEFCCFNCKNVSVKIADDGYVEGDWSHGCSEHSVINFEIVHPNPNNEIRKHPLLITFIQAENYQLRCYVLSWMNDRKSYRCRRCQKNKNGESKSVYARIWKDKNGKKYVHLTDSHICGPLEVKKNQNGEIYVECRVQNRKNNISLS